MKNNRRHFDPEELFAVDIDHFPNFSLTDEAKRIFRQKVCQYIWVLYQNGLLISKRHKHQKTVNYRVDLYDWETKNCFNQIPVVFAKNPDPVLLRAWRLKIYDPEMQGGGNSDTLCMDEQGYLYILEYQKAWNEFKASTDFLGKEVARITRTLR